MSSHLGYVIPGERGGEGGVEKTNAMYLYVHNLARWSNKSNQVRGVQSSKFSTNSLKDPEYYK